MKQERCFLLPACAALGLARAPAAEVVGKGASFDLSAPDTRIRLWSNLADGKPQYSVWFKDRPLILRSVRGVELKEGSLSSSFEITANVSASVNEASPKIRL